MCRALSRLHKGRAQSLMRERDAGQLEQPDPGAFGACVAEDAITGANDTIKILAVLLKPNGRNQKKNPGMSEKGEKRKPQKAPPPARPDIGAQADRQKPAARLERY